MGAVVFATIIVLRVAKNSPVTSMLFAETSVRIYSVVVLCSVNTKVLNAFYGLSSLSVTRASGVLSAQ